MLFIITSIIISTLVDLRAAQIAAREGNYGQMSIDVKMAAQTLRKLQGGFDASQLDDWLAPYGVKGRMTPGLLEGWLASLAHSTAESAASQLQYLPIQAELKAWRRRFRKFSEALDVIADCED